LALTALSTTQVRLTWTEYANNEAGFKIERKLGSGGTYSQLGTVSADVTNYSDGGLQPGNNYYYRVRAYNVSGNSAYSAEASVTMPSSGGNPVFNRVGGGTAMASMDNPPSESAGAAFDGSTGTKWYSPSTAPQWLQYRFNNVTAWAITEYKIISANDEAGRDPMDWQLLGSNDGVNWITLDTRTGQVFSGRFTANIYDFVNTALYKYYRLNVSANAGGFTFGVQLSELALYSSNTPGAPVALTATAASDSQIDLAWTDNATNETGFNIERKLGSGGTYSQIATVAANATSYSDMDLAAGTEYYYQVQATNAAGNSAYSNEASATSLQVRPILHVFLTDPGISSNLTITWIGTGTLESATTLNGVWTPMGTTSPVSINPTGSVQLYRVVSP
jgi:hypothetical protein